MIFDHGFLTSLRADDPQGWADELHAYLAGTEHELAGALLVREGRPFAVTSHRIVELRAASCSPGGLLGQALWLGADQLVPFHTQVTAKSYEAMADDVVYAQRLRDLAQLFGTFTLAEHLLITPHGSVGLGAQLSPPATLPQMEKWQVLSPEKRAPRYRHPVSGEVWSGIGRYRPEWVDEALTLGFVREDFLIPQVPGFRSPRGVPPGAGSFLTTSLDLGPAPSVGGLEEIPSHGGFELPVDSFEVFPPLVRHVQGGSDSRVGVLFVDENDLVTTPRAGWIAPEALVTKQAGHLFATTGVDEPAWALTFSTVPTTSDRFLSGRRDLLRRLVFLGHLLGVPIRDHLLIHDDGRFLSTRADRRLARAWPEVPPVGEPVWPHFLRPQQTSSTVRHPEGDETWDGRGPTPQWLQNLLDAGWSLDELRRFP